tara:strand:+ start:537 stop:914 length:378 start_codon:yes stop_codon:yes gene_type:complete
MPKRKLTEIAGDMGISFEEALEISSLHLEEEMVTGRGKNTWINDDGQDIMDSYITVPQIYRGKILSVAPNAKFSYVYIKEMLKKAPIIMPRRLQGQQAVGKYVYIEVDNSGDEPKFKWIAPPTVD